MKKIGFLVLVLALIMISGLSDVANATTEESSITIISPNGGEQWTQGQTYQVTWQRTNFNDEVAINLIDYTPGSRYGMQYGITNGDTVRTVAGQTTFSWTIPTSVPSGDCYKVSIGMGSVNDFSDNYFSIVEPVLPPPPVKVTATLDGKEWQGLVIFDISRQANFDGMDASGQFQVPWEYNYYEYPNSTNIYLRYREKDGFQSGPPNAYLARITAAWNGSEGDFNAPIAGPCLIPVKFNLEFKTAPSITVVSPNGGEKWNEGKTYRIKWEQAGLNQEKVDILLGGYDQRGNPIRQWYWIASNVTAGQAYFDWEIPPKINTYFQLSPEKYKIEITQIIGGKPAGISDESDDYFRILVHGSKK